MIDDKGNVDQHATDTTTGHYGRDVLAPGRHEDSAYLSLATQSFPTIVACLYRNSEQLWDTYTGAAHDVAGFYDLWLQVCVLGISSPVWYSPRRLASYRVHGGQMISRRDIGLSLAMVWILQRALASPKFTSARPQILRRIASSYHSAGMRSLRVGDRTMAAHYLRLALAVRPNAHSAAALILSCRYLLPVVDILVSLREGERQ
jgi:hypothetical protein